MFMILSWRYNALLSGDVAAKSVGVNVELLRFISLLLSSVIVAVCVSFLGIIGFVGIICPHITKKNMGTESPLFHTCVSAYGKSFYFCLLIQYQEA